MLQDNPPNDFDEQDRIYIKSTTVPGGACMGVFTSGAGENGGQVIAEGSLAFTGNLNLYMDVFYVQGTIIATREFNPKKWVELIDSYNVNYIYLIPTKMLALEKAVRQPMTMVKHFVTGSQGLGKQDTLGLKISAYSIERILLYNLQIEKIAIIVKRENKKDVMYAYYGWISFH